MPPVVAAHVLAYLFEVGPSLVSGMGEGPLTNEELAAWQANIGIELQPWEARALLRLSREYLYHRKLYEKPNSPQPWSSGQPTAEQLHATGLSLRNALRSM